MRCKICDYQLWTIRSRVCPECGSGFAPSDYDFNLNAVRFCCPHCEQQYFGTAANGHLDPIEFECVRCRRLVHMDEMVLLPREGIAERLTESAKVPWTDLSRRWFVTRWFPTLGLSLGAPGRLMKMLPEDASSGRALWFAFFNINFAVLLSVGVIFGFGIIMSIISGSGSGSGSGGGLGGLGMALLGVIIWLASSVVFLLIWAGIAQLICGPGSPKGGRYERAFQSVCYSSGAMALTAVPCLGMYIVPVALIWWTISLTLALRESHGVSGLRAFLGAAIPPGLVVGGVVTWFVVIIYSGVSAARSYSSGSHWSSFDDRKARIMSSTIGMASMQNGSRYPVHGLELLTSGWTQASEFQSFANATGNNPTYQGDDLGLYLNGTRSVRDAANALPAGVTAHRVADFVFTWHGFDSTTDGDLWVAVLAPRAGSRAAGQGMSWWVIEADGDVWEVAPMDRLQKLSDQNQIRSGHGLATLPDLDLVTDTQPATP